MNDSVIGKNSYGVEDKIFALGDDANRVKKSYNLSTPVRAVYNILV